MNDLKDIDSSIIRKDIHTKEHLKIKKFPLFSIVEFNIWGACNRSCSFCPVSNPEIFTNKHEGINIDLYKKIINDLSQVQYNGKIIFSAFSEPLLNKDINILVKYTKEVLPECFLEINTNGDVIKKDIKKVFKLYESGLDCLIISVYDGKEAYDEFKEIQRENKIPEVKFILRRRYFDKESGNYGIIFSNRAGTVDLTSFNNQDDSVEKSLPLERVCYYPFYNVMIDYNGDMLLCPHDWAKKLILSNLADTNIIEVWDEKLLNFARKRLSSKKRTFSPCNTCDVRGDVIGEDSFNAWKIHNKL